MLHITCAPRHGQTIHDVNSHVWSYPRRSYILSFIEIRSGVSEPHGVEICPFPLLWLLAFTTACTAVQAVISLPHYVVFYRYCCRDSGLPFPKLSHRGNFAAEMVLTEFTAIGLRGDE